MCQLDKFSNCEKKFDIDVSTQSNYNQYAKYSVYSIHWGIDQTIDQSLYKKTKKKIVKGFGRLLAKEKLSNE